MGFFDGQIAKLGETLSKGFIKRADEIKVELQTEKDPGKSLINKIVCATLIEISNVIQASLIDS